MTPEEQIIRDQAVQWAKSNRTSFARQVSDPERYPSEDNPVSFFMAGSPGAGKTEMSKALSEALGNFLRIDPDDFRQQIPGYDGTNSWLFQDAVSLLLERVIDRVFKNKQSFLLDGTLSSYPIAERNIERCVSKGRSVLIMYVYQDPALAWSFVQARELAEGRRIPADRFVNQFFASRDVVNALKVKFGQDIEIDVVLKDFNGSNQRYFANVNDLNQVAPLQHTEADVRKIVGLPA